MCLLAVCLLTVALARATKNPVPVYLVAGQSNTDGRVPNSGFLPTSSRLLTSTAIGAMAAGPMAATGSLNFSVRESSIRTCRGDGPTMP